MTAQARHLATARRLGPVLVLAAVILGIGVGSGPARPRRASPSAAVLLALAAVGCATARQGGVGLVCVGLAALLGGWAATARALDGQVHSPLAVAVRDRVYATVDATLTTDPDASRFAARGRGHVCVGGSSWWTVRAPPRRASLCSGPGTGCGSGATSGRSTGSRLAPGGSTRSARSPPTTCSGSVHRHRR